MKNHQLLLLAACIGICYAICKDNAECKTGCCLGIGKLRFCKNYLKEGEKCTIGSKIGCGCDPTLACVKTGSLTKKCVNLRKDCGKPEVKGERIIAGKTVIKGSWPWQGLMLHDWHPMCGATLIAPQWVLTAAHCVYGRDKDPMRFRIKMGAWDRDLLESTTADQPAVKIFIHPGYEREAHNNDVALMKVQWPFRLNKWIKTACLPSGEPKVGTNCYVTGWGKIHHPGQMNEILQQGRLTVVSKEVCQAKNYKTLRVQITDSMVCAGDGGKTRLSACHGDSGGPFVCNVNGLWEVHGAVSWGSPTCDSKEAYPVFARAYHFLDWITETMHSG